MATHKQIPPFRLTAAQRKAILAYLKGQATQRGTAIALGVTQQRFYTMIAVLMRHMVTTKKIEVDALIKEY